MAGIARKEASPRHQSCSNSAAHFGRLRALGPVPKRLELCSISGGVTSSLRARPLTKQRGHMPLPGPALAPRFHVRRRQRLKSFTECSTGMRPAKPPSQSQQRQLALLGWAGRGTVDVLPGRASRTTDSASLVRSTGESTASLNISTPHGPSPAVPALFVLTRCCPLLLPCAKVHTPQGTGLLRSR